MTVIVENAAPICLISFVTEMRARADVLKATDYLLQAVKLVEGRMKGA